MATLSYMGAQFEIMFAPGVKTSVMALLGDYFTEVKNEGTQPSFRIRLHSKTATRLQEILEFGDPVIIHNSKKPSVHEVGLRLDIGLTRSIYNKATKGVYVLNRMNDTVDIFNEDPGALSRDTIRVARDLVKRYVETNSEAVLLHAAAVTTSRREGILLIGGKGSGKSTMMLEMIYNHEYKEVSRDRTFVVETASQGFAAYGFPNYYNLGARTLSTFDISRRLLPEEYRGLRSDQLDKVRRKWQFLPDDLGIAPSRREATCHITSLVFLSIEPADAIEVLAENCYTPWDINYPDWHEWRQADLARVDKVRQILNRMLTLDQQFINWKSDLSAAGRQIAGHVSKHSIS